MIKTNKPAKRKAKVKEILSKTICADNPININVLQNTIDVEKDPQFGLQRDIENADFVFQNEFELARHPFMPKDKKQMSRAEQQFLTKKIKKYKPISKLMKNHWHELGLVKSKKFGMSNSRSRSKSRSKSKNYRKRKSREKSRRSS